MKIKRFVASNMRQALLNVRKEQGPNAVILSNRRVDDGIEVVAAVDYDETLMNQSVAQVAAPALDVVEDDAIPEAISEDYAPLDVEDHDALATMRNDMHDMRELLTDQLSSLAWNDEVRRDPATVSVLRHYAAVGLDTDVARDVAMRAARDESSGNYIDRAGQALAKALPVLEENLLDTGGVIAVVGPTGVGKTTSIAKLAARFALRHGRDQVALVSTDSFRIGAQEQLATFAQILDVPVHLVTDENDLSLILSTLTDKKLVLIDTAGVSQRAQGLDKHLKAFGTGPQKIRMYLTLAATGQSQTLNEVISEFSCVPLDGCILTKVDEAASMGAAFSAIIRHRLPIAFLANGQKVPEDLHAAKGRKSSMVNYGMRLMRESRPPIDEEFMARNFGEVRTHACA